MEGRCERHPFDRAIDVCGRCGCEFCGDCLVYSFGTTKPPFCLPCAVAAAGVRSGAGYRPPLPRREQKRLRKERERALRAHAEVAAPAESRPGPKAPVAVDWCVPLDGAPQVAQG